MARLGLWLPLLTSLVSSACVIGRSSRPTLSESAQGPTAPTVNGGPVVPHTAPEPQSETPAQAKPGSLWVQGYWHWDGVHYVWQRGHWERARP
ncbi:MAG TPA: YXWGXW repeat-containing protein [Polyangiaceae bacterium]|nr:YXWGXW repeat-containing protein [Polyangiaceae bacterium]